MSHTNRLLRRAAAATAYRDMKRLAAEHGMTLTKYSDSHYQLLHVKRRWMMSVYPAAQSAYWVPCASQAPGNANEWPVLAGRNWTLATAVEAAIQWEAKAEGRETTP